MKSILKDMAVSLKISGCLIKNGRTVMLVILLPGYFLIMERREKQKNEDHLLNVSKVLSGSVA